MLAALRDNLSWASTHQPVPSDEANATVSSQVSSEPGAVTTIERARLFGDKARDSAVSPSHDSRLSAWDGSLYCNRAKMVTGTIVGVLLVVQVGLALVAALAPSYTHNISQDLQRQLEREVPAGVQIEVPPASGQPIKKGPKTRPNDTVVLPHLDTRVPYGDLLKPRYHLTPPSGWMNDPNGMLQAPGGPVHVFYQWNPEQPQWGSPWWGHVVSWDLVKWTRLQAAFKPDMWYDRDGVFSGSATILPDGTPFMMFTGVMNYSDYNFYYQTQGAAVPANASDPLFTNWTKLPEPLSMDIPPGGTHAQFRDPTTAWQVSSNEVSGLLSGLGLSGLVRGRRLGEGPSSTAPVKRPPKQVVVGTGSALPDSGNTSEVPAVDAPGLWMTAVGVQDDCLGAAALYLSNDSLRTWHYSGTLYSQLSQNFTETAVCLPPPGERDALADVPAGTKGFGGACDQFGSVCRMWECPDFFSPADGVQAFKYSDQNRDRPLFAADYYVLGDSTLTNYTLALVQDGHDAYSGTLDGASYLPRPLDYGVVYASKSFRTDPGSKGGSRLLWLGWVYEDSLGCSEVCGDGTPFILDHQQWQGAQTLLREISYSPDTQSLLFQPVPEMAQLRQPQPLFPPQLLTLDTAGAAGAADQTAGVAVAPLVEGREPAAVAGVSGAAPAAANASASASGGRQVEVDLWFSLKLDATDPSGTGKHGRGPHAATDPPAPGATDPQPFSLTVRIYTGNGTYTDVVVNGTAAPSAGSPADKPDGGGSNKAQHTPEVHAMYVWVDRAASGGMTPNTSHGGPVPLPQAGRLLASKLRVQLYVDRSVLEVYVQSGAAVVTSRIYPTPLLPADSLDATGRLQDGSLDWAALGSWGYELRGVWSAGSVHADVGVYELDSCWTHEGDELGEDGLNG